jgi:hypothetical protein
MRRVGRTLREAGVRAVYLVHGTFVGADALGVLAELDRVFPVFGEILRGALKQMVDNLAGDAGNYTGAFARQFEEAMRLPGEPDLPVRLFRWSSENNHVGRADGAVRLIDQLSQESGDGRVLLWGHSHAGNVFALTTNLLAGDEAAIRSFFDAARVYYRWPLVGCIDIPHWQRVRQWLESRRQEFDRPQLDFVTFGTPIRYGWDSNGYSRLLHFVNHHPAQGLPEYQAPFPPKAENVLAAADGDYIQQLGIAGTDLWPSVFAWRTLLAENRLDRLLEPGQGLLDLPASLKAGVRVPEEGSTLLVDYGPPSGHIGQHHAGHAVYTREEWLLFHAESVAQQLYAEDGVLAGAH